MEWLAGGAVPEIPNPFFPGVNTRFGCGGLPDKEKVGAYIALGGHSCASTVARGETRGVLDEGLRIRLLVIEPG